MPFRQYALHGLQFLRESLWDSTYGGFFWDVGKGAEKHAYGVAFGITAGAAVYGGTGDPAGLSLAQEAFSWLDGHAHDPERGGYWEALNRDGSPLEPGEGAQDRDLIGTPYGRRSFNSHLHLLEALMELYRVWPVPRVEGRLEELLDLTLRRLVREPGYAPGVFTKEWEPLESVASYGHDLEAAYWIVEVSRVLGREDDPETWARAGQLVQHSLRHGFDATHGGFFLEGRAGARAHRREKVWWVQVEGLCTLALFHRRFADDTPLYFRRFRETWEFVSRRLVDRRFGGLYGTVAEGGRWRLDKRKGHAWKGAYHEVRCLLSAAASFRNISSPAASDPQGATPAQQS